MSEIPFDYDEFYKSAVSGDATLTGCRDSAWSYTSMLWDFDQALQVNFNARMKLKNLFQKFQFVVYLPHDPEKHSKKFTELVTATKLDVELYAHRSAAIAKEVSNYEQNVPLLNETIGKDKIPMLIKLLKHHLMWMSKLNSELNRIVSEVHQLILFKVMDDFTGRCPESVTSLYFRWLEFDEKNSAE